MLLTLTSGTEWNDENPRINALDILWFKVVSVSALVGGKVDFSSVLVGGCCEPSTFWLSSEEDFGLVSPGGSRIS